jgi:hypothetical protein
VGPWGGAPAGRIRRQQSDRHPNRTHTAQATALTWPRGNPYTLEGNGTGTVGDGGFQSFWGGGSYQIRILMYPTCIPHGSWVYPVVSVMIHQETFVSEKIASVS